MVSIIIPVYNLMDYTKKAVAALKKHTDSSYEVIISDDGSEVDYRSWAQKEGYKYVKGTRRGFAAACNRGSQLAEGDTLVFLNNDTVVMNGWLPPLLEAVSNGYAAAAPLLLYPGGTIQHCGVVVGWALGKLQMRHIYEGYPLFPPALKQREFQALTGACLAVKRSVWEKIGGFDESYVNGCEDLDFCLKLRWEGRKLLFCPRSRVVHFGGMTPGRFDHEKKNYELFLRRWQGKVKIDEWRYYLEDLPYSLPWIVKVGFGSFCPKPLRRAYWRMRRWSLRRGIKAFLTAGGGVNP